jgi:hypothetical protein
MVYHFKWHVSKKVIRNENFAGEDKKPVGCFTFHQGKWVLVNQSLPSMKDVTEGKEISPNTTVTH